MSIEGSTIIAEIARLQAERAAAMPTVEDALKQIAGAMQRLDDLGFRDAIYAPKDGTVVDLIEAGTAIVLSGHYMSYGPGGCFFVHCEGDLWPSNPILFRPRTAPEQAGGE